MGIYVGGEECFLHAASVAESERLFNGQPPTPDRRGAGLSGAERAFVIVFEACNAERSRPWPMPISRRCLMSL